MHIDEILNAVALGKLPLIPANWGQGRTTFGGLTAAILCQAMDTKVSGDRYLRSFEVGFIRPLESQKPYDIEIQTLGDGKTVTSLRAYLYQESKLRATATSLYVLPIDSSVTIDHFVPPEIREADESVHLQGDDLPNFFTHFDSRVATDGMPFHGNDIPELGGWMRFKETPEKITNAHLVCMIDAWPPTAATHYVGFKPLSTVSWSIHFTSRVAKINPTSHLGYHALVNFAENGLSSSKAHIWDESGNLLAHSTQTNIIYG